MFVQIIDYEQHLCKLIIKGIDILESTLSF